MESLRILAIYPETISDGYGLRYAIYFAGCAHRCPGCHNPQSHDPLGGEPLTAEWTERICDAIAANPILDGVTVSGGDPLHAANEAEILALAKDIRSRFPGKTIWMYTGYDWEYVKTREVARWIDVLVDGPYKKDLRDTQLHWRGSSNQHVIEVSESLASGKMVLHCA